MAPIVWSREHWARDPSVPTDPWHLTRSQREAPPLPDSLPEDRRHDHLRPSRFRPRRFHPSRRRPQSMAAARRHFRRPPGVLRHDHGSHSPCPEGPEVVGRPAFLLRLLNQNDCFRRLLFQIRLAPKEEEAQPPCPLPTTRRRVRPCPILCPIRSPSLLEMAEAQLRWNHRPSAIRPDRHGRSLHRPLRRASVAEGRSPNRQTPGMWPAHVRCRPQLAWQAAEARLQHLRPRNPYDRHHPSHCRNLAVWVEAERPWMSLRKRMHSAHRARPRHSPPMAEEGPPVDPRRQASLHARDCYRVLPPEQPEAEARPRPPVRTPNLRALSVRRTEAEAQLQRSRMRARAGPAPGRPAALDRATAAEGLRLDQRRQDFQGFVQIPESQVAVRPHSPWALAGLGCRPYPPSQREERPRQPAEVHLADSYDRLRPAEERRRRSWHQAGTGRALSPTAARTAWPDSKTQDSARADLPLTSNPEAPPVSAFRDARPGPALLPARALGIRPAPWPAL